jgi:two-component system NarL family sensor kinase
MSTGPTDQRDPTGPSAGGWITLASPAQRGPAEKPLSVRRIVAQLIASAVVVTALVVLGGSLISRYVAENQSVHEVAQTTDILADSVLQPALTDAMATDPTAAAALDGLVRARILSSSLVRVKIWSSDGTIRYSDETRLVGRNFPLDSGAQAAFSTPQTQAEITELGRPENVFERGQGKLLEVYRPVWTPQGHELLFETYFRYDLVTDRSTQLWKGFLGITLSSVALIFALLVPVVAAMFVRTRRAQAQRELMIQRALDASRDERQRIAAALHDGLVQELAAASFAVSAGAQSAAAHGDDDLARDLTAAGTTVRSGMAGLRSLVIDIYPPSLRSAGLAATLRDMAATVAGRAVQVEVQLDEDAIARLSEPEQQAVFRVAQECLRNVVKHADASTATLLLVSDGTDVALEISDDGRGFDPSIPRERHLGLRLMTDVATEIGARLQVSSDSVHGTIWRMAVPAR